MSAVNPYASPSAELLHRVHEGCRRDGDAIYVPRGVDLPPRCIRCNAPVATPIKRRTLYWHSPLLYLVILVNLLVYAIVALVVRKRVEVSPALCGSHARARRRDLVLGFGVMATAVVGVFVALSNEQGGAAGIAGLVAFVAMIVTALRSRLVRATRIDDAGARLVGFGRPYLDAIGRR